jgi:hypothetical protein
MTLFGLLSELLVAAEVPTKANVDEDERAVLTI